MPNGSLTFKDWTLVSLPFTVPASQLPGSLPTEEEILKSTNVLSSEYSSTLVVGVGPHFVAKHGESVSEVEGQTLLFLEQYRNKSLAVPTLYAMYRLPSTGDLCLVIQRLPGDTLEHLWPELDEKEKSGICTRLKSAIEYLRAIPTAGFYGGVGRTCIPYHLFWHPDEQKEICGPFDSENQFNAGLVQKLRDMEDLNHGNMTAKVDFYARNLDTMLRSHCPVFTHSDLQRKNILVHRKQGEASRVFIIDWETAGWYPSYWKYSLKIVTMQWTDDWPKYLEQILQTWPCEAAALRMIYQDLWF